MRTIGIDLAVTGAHKAVVTDAAGQALTPVLTVSTDPTALDALLARAREGEPERMPLRAIMEPTGLAWFPVACYLTQRQVTVYLVKTQQVADLRRFYRKHAKSDRIDCRVLAQLPLVNPEQLYPLWVPEQAYFSGQRLCRQYERFTGRITAIQNRIQAWERAFWPGLEATVPNLFSSWMRRFREVWYDPWRVAEAPPTELAQWLQAGGLDIAVIDDVVVALQQVACRAVALFGTPDGHQSPYVDYARLQDIVLRELRLLVVYEEEQRLLKREIRRLYRRIHPSGHLETLKGVGELGAPVFAFFVGDAARFSSQAAFRGWSGMIPAGDQSGQVQQKGLSLTQAGPDIIKKYAYLAGNTARQWDPQIAAIYYDQMVNKGKHHTQAVCICATRMLDRIRAILRDDRAYGLRDVDGTPVSSRQARAIIQERYTVPEEVRRRRSARTRKVRLDTRAERKQKRRSLPGS